MNSKTKPEIQAIKIQIKGIVQGVGFRPFVYSLAIRNNLKGWVRNSSNGVEIEVSGDPLALDNFSNALRNSAPPLSRIDSISSEFIPVTTYKDFEILKSNSQEGEFIPVSPDYSICEDCLKELFDPNDRRYRYPFINCTNCGPRFTIIKDIPYDRPNTTMASFDLCDACLQEYKNPLDRRYHAQPVACPRCGPEVKLELNKEIIDTKDHAIKVSRQMVKAGKILAIKGLGGYHLACDASNFQAVENLRKRKKRSDKPFALMAFSLETISEYCYISESEKNLLISKERPIVLLKIKDSTRLSPIIAPNQNYYGFMLPYTPLHYLLLEPTEGIPPVWVMTSGNLSEEPIAYKDDESNDRLGKIADAFLVHNRDIHMRVDDSVTRIINGEIYPIRRARGYAPNPVILPANLPQILAAGAELKNTFCLTRENYAFMSHHIGDLENYETLKSFEEAIEHYQKLFRIKPELIASDLHPDYLASRYAIDRSYRDNVANIKIQHHHAHLAAVLADNHWNNDNHVIGLIYDGTGYGTDGAIWGGEVLIGNYAHYQRKYHLRYVHQPGGDISVRIPARMALSHLWEYNLDWDLSLPAADSLCMEERTALKAQLTNYINSPKTSSMGRLFDAVASLIGVRHKVNYEGQAAIELESLVDEEEKGHYPFNLINDIIDPQPLFESIIVDLHNHESINKIAAKFHNSITNISVEICKSIRNSDQINTVALSGGVWQNKVLLLNTTNLLKNEGFEVCIHHNVPANDGGLSLGQVMIASKTIN